MANARATASNLHASAAPQSIGRAGPNPAELELLRAASLAEGPAADAWRRWSMAHHVDDVTHRAGDLLPAVSANLPDEVLGHEAGRLRGLRRRAWAETQFRLSALHGAVAVIADLGVRPLVVKGASLATTVYDVPGIRSMSDIDLVVDPERFDEIRTAFLAANWRTRAEPESPFDHAIELWDEDRRSLDLHRWVLFPRYVTTPEHAWIERAVEHRIGPSDVMRLRSADETVLAILHGLGNKGLSSVRWPLDVLQATRRGPAVDGLTPEAFWAEVVESATAIGAGPYVAAGLEFCRTEFHAEVPTDEIERLQSAPLSPHLRWHWILARRGITPEWRYRRFRAVQRAQGRPASPVSYARMRVDTLRSKGFRSTASQRVDHLRRTLHQKREMLRS